jgi:hypothetical protein
MSIYHDLEAIKSVAIEATKEDGYNYNIILNNPNDKGEFDLSVGSTYEFVADSYFNKPRPNTILLFKTKDLLQQQEVDRLIDSFSPEAPAMKMRQVFQKMDADIQYAKNSEEGADNKLKKGLSVVHAEADGINYKQGKAGLERITGTNRNDKCNCGSGKKFKKCCGK